MGCTVPGAIATYGIQQYLDGLAEQSGKTAAEVLQILVTGWLNIPTPQVSETSGVVQHLRAYTGWAVAAVAVGSVLVAAIKLALERNGREAGTLAKNLVLLAVLAVAGVPAVQLLLSIGDSYADWILNAAANRDLGKRFMQLAPATATSSLTALMTIGISLMVILASLVQLVLLLARNVVLLLLAGLLPLAGAAGGQLRNRYLTWLLALLLYKPAAATIYATVFWLIGEGKTLTDILTGLVGFCMALVALPALMRLIAPAVSTLSSGGGGTVLAAASAAGQVASGAVRLAGSGGRSGGTQSKGGQGRPVGASTSTDPPYPPSRPSGGSGPATGGTGTTAGSGTAGVGAAMSGVGAGASSSAGGAGVGAGAAAGGTVGLAASTMDKAAKAGPATVRKVGGASGAATDEGS
ncbi:hypothetical protein ACFY2R_26485 [Micromonospora olivasterospora]|uniref:hypothetical protein n=1 Tax=Micromonospora olivasterospora TaxID=1880 RepID=UPI001FE43DD0|nr:hypothetical protein [Micromonospora olivasterospora]